MTHHLLNYLRNICLCISGYVHYDWQIIGVKYLKQHSSPYSINAYFCHFCGAVKKARYQNLYIADLCSSNMSENKAPLG